MYYSQIIEKLQNLTNKPSTVKITDIFGNKLSGFEKIVHINIQYEDCILKQTNKIKDFSLTSCKKAEIYNNEELIKSIYMLINELDRKGGSIEINLYEKGTQIGFLYAEEPTFIEDKRLEISNPGINSEILDLYQNYYLIDLKNDKQLDLIKDKLVKIERVPKYGFNLYFKQGNKIEILTRGHSEEAIAIVNRSDQYLITKSKEKIKNYIVEFISKNIDLMKKREVKRLIDIAANIN